MSAEQSTDLDSIHSGQINIPDTPLTVDDLELPEVWDSWEDLVNADNEARSRVKGTEPRTVEKYKEAMLKRIAEEEQEPPQQSWKDRLPKPLREIL